MHKKANLLLLLLYLLSVFIAPLAMAQGVREASTGYNLEWTNDLVSQIHELETTRNLNFKGATFDGTARSLPVYTAILPWNYNGSAPVVSLKNVVTEAFTPNSASVNPDKVAGEFKLEYHLVYNRKKAMLGISLVAVRKNPNSGAFERILSFDFDIQAVAQRAIATGTPQRIFVNSSVLTSGNWYRIAVVNDGVHKVTYDFLKQMGIKPDSLNPADVRLFGNGGGMLPFLNSKFRHDDLVENSIQVVDDGVQGSFDNGDYFLFYGESPNQWYFDTLAQQYYHQVHVYSDTTYYFFTTDPVSTSQPKRIQNRPNSTQSPNYTTTTFEDYKYHEVDRLNFIKSGRQWYGEQFDVELSQTFNFSFPGIDLSEPVYIKSSVIAHSFSPSYFRAYHNNQLLFQQNVASVGSSYTSDYAAANISTGTFTASGSSVNIRLDYTPTTSTSAGYLDYIELIARRNLSLTGSQMIFRDSRSAGIGKISSFNFLNGIQNVTIWDVTDPTTVVEQKYSSQGFVTQTDDLKEFVIFNGSSFLSPKPNGKVENQNLHALAQADYIIVTHPDFLNEANRLASFHRDYNNLSVHVVTQQQVYNEFSSGVRDIIAIRDLMKMFYDRAVTTSDMPKYLLMFGDGSFNNKSTSSSNTNFLPTYESSNSISLIGSYVSDDFMGFLDDQEGDWEDATQDLLDIGIGRFPVATVSEARLVVDKTIDYTMPGTLTDLTVCNESNATSLGDWRNVLTFVADDEDGALHLDQSNNIANFVTNNHPVYNVDKIFIDAYQQLSTPGGQRYPAAYDAIKTRVQRGSLIINYTGHGGETGWAGERILDNTMINEWTNKRKLSLFITATCEFSRWDDPGRTSAGEYVLLNPNGAGIALMSTTRLVYASQNFVLNTALIADLLTKFNGERPRLGDIYRETKTDPSVMAGGINPRNFSLLGDPALMLAYPDYQIETTAINGQPVVADNDTLNALEKVTINGEIRNNGQKLGNYNGIIFPTIYDKAVNVSTLSNDGTSPLRTFKLQKNILYKGKASVVNGEFSFTFIVPKDIAYQIGRGRFSYYALDGNTDANGYFDSLMIGGSSSNPVADNLGPEINLFMNDEKFIFGGTTDEKPKILALVNDSNGINTVGNGIGHDITATIDGETDKAYVLNDFYESDLDSYQSGRVVFQLDELPEGRHTLKLKVWDIYNNSSDAYTEFVVAESAELALNHVLNYPNPFTTKTSFFFEHNKACITLNVQIQIFTVSGKIIKTLERTTLCDGYRIDDITWDGRDDYGDPIGKGVYIYRLRVRAADGTSAEKYEKLVLLK
jgi:Peptidase family C25